MILGLATCGLLSLSTVAINSVYDNTNKINGESGTSEIKFTHGKNHLVDSGSGDEKYPVTSEAGTSIRFRYNGLDYIDANNNWANLVSGSYFLNVDSITRLSSLTLTGLTGSVDVYWSDTTVFNDDAKVTLTGSTLSTDFASYAPRHFKVLATEASAIVSVDVKYTCVEDKLVRFGSYPQSHVTDTTTTADLTEAAGTLPVNGTPASWTSFGFYLSGSNATDFTWYQDITYGGSKYRGVYFTDYRSVSTTSTETWHYQSMNGYTKGSVYWFKFEPITWQLLATNNKKISLLSKTILSAKDFYHTFTDHSASIHANNYAESNIRAWLNSSFYGAAFNSNEQTAVASTVVDNSAATTYTLKDGTNPYACENTTDNVFLPSFKDITNADYRFSTGTGTTTTRQIVATDYALSINASGGSVFDYHGAFWLRSPANDLADEGEAINYEGDVSPDSDINICYGVLPSVNVDLRSFLSFCHCLFRLFSLGLA